MVGEVGGEFVEVGMRGCDGLAGAVEAYYFWRAFEAAKHDDDAAVFLQVGDGFDAAAGKVLIGYGMLIEHAEGVEAFGRYVDVAIAGKWCGAYEK